MSDCCIIYTVFLVIFSGTSTVFHIGYAILNSYQQGTKVPLFHILANICYIYIYIYKHMFNWFPFFWYWLILHTFPIYIDHFNVFYEEMSVEALYTFFKLNYLPRVVYKLSCTYFLYILYIGPFFSYKVCRYFLSQYWLHFYSVDCWGDYSFFTW